MSTIGFYFFSLFVVFRRERSLSKYVHFASSAIAAQAMILRFLFPLRTAFALAESSFFRIHLTVFSFFHI